MSVLVTFNSTGYLIPTTGETGWAQVMTNFLSDVGNNAVTKTNAAITSGNIDGTIIGGTTPANGTFSNLTATTSATVPTLALNDSSTKVASTAFVQNQIAANTGGLPVFKNYLINGGMSLWQRGTSLTPSSGLYAADMMQVAYDSAAPTISQVAVTDPTVLAAGLPYAAQYTVGSSSSATRYVMFKVENARALAGKTARLTFWAKADATRSLTSYITVYPGTGGSPAGTYSTSTQTQNLTTSWQQFTMTFVLNAASTITLGTNNDSFLGVVINIPPAAALTIQLTGVQLEQDVGAITAFDQRPPQVELAMAQRYCQTGDSRSSGYQVTGGGILFSAPFPVKMRSNPGITTNSAGSNLTSYAVSANTSSIIFSATVVATGSYSYTNIGWLAEANL